MSIDSYCVLPFSDPSGRGRGQCVVPDGFSGAGESSWKSLERLKKGTPLPAERYRPAQQWVG